MPTPDGYEAKLLAAYNKGALKSIASKSELARFKASARATGGLSKKAAPTCQSPAAPKPRATRASKAAG